MTFAIGARVLVEGREAVVREVRPADEMLSESVVFAYTDTGEVSRLPSFLVQAAENGNGHVEAALTADEQTQLEAYEVVIANGLQTFYAVGTALAEIRDNRLYRAEYRTFEDYCDQRWQMTRRHAYRLIDAAEAVENVSHGTQMLPINERQARPLTELEPEAQRLAWEVVKETAPQGKVTAAHVKSVVSVLKEALTTGAIDAGEGESVPVDQATVEHFKAAVTEETYERMKRQEMHIAERQQRKADLVERQQQQRERAAELPEGVYSVIYADPAWEYSNSGINTAAAHQYQTMPTPEICTLLNTLGVQPASEAVLLLWATNALLADALCVMDAWRFRYVTNRVWVKDRGVGGFHVNGRHELLLIGVRGSFPPVALLDSVITGANDVHSRKPELYADIETAYPNQRYIELFARNNPPRNGWTFWGDQANGTD